MIRSILLSLSLALLGLPACSQPIPSNQGCIPSQSRWAGDFSQPNWPQTWSIADQGAWGLENFAVVTVPDRSFSQALRVVYPAGSASPHVARKQGTPLGGGQFYTTVQDLTGEQVCLSYWVRFSPNFDFVKGGKLPGLYGGTATSGGENPDGRNGFSTRLMWREQGQGEVYAYLPNGETYGTSIGRGSWRFQPDRWYLIEQEVTLNEPGQSNGQIRLWVDDRLVLNQTGLLFRTTDTLRVNGLFFSTFFGGSDASWATPREVYADFAEFEIMAQ